MSQSAARMTALQLGTERNRKQRKVDPRGLSSARDKAENLPQFLRACPARPIDGVAWVNNSADGPNENVVKLTSSAKQPSKNRCGARRRALIHRKSRHH